MPPSISNNGKEFPRELTALERELIFSQLPENSKAYRDYRELIGRMKVVGLGKRGAGHLVLGEQKPHSDTLQLVTPVFAFGGAERNRTSITVVIHEFGDDVISVELMTLNGEFEELGAGQIKTWSISDWSRGSPCPKCGTPVKEVDMPMLKSGKEATLAVCRKHRGIWISDGDLGMNHIIPVTGYLSELVRQRAIAARSREYRPAAEVFGELDSFSAREFVRAFVLYNKFWRKMDIQDVDFAPPAKRSIAARFVSRLVGKDLKGRGNN